MPARFLRHLFASGMIIGTVLASTATLQAEEPPKKNVEVTIPNMHCESCARKIRSQLFTIAGVSKVITKVAENRAEIVARSGKALSAFEIWDKLEKAKFTPSKLVMPDAEYTEKPPQEPSRPANAPATT